MRAIVFDAPGDESVLHLGESPAPELSPRDLRIRVHAAGVNRADLLQRRGFYPPPAGASEILGLECSGEVIEVGSEVTGWQRGDRAMALLPGGGYAEEAIVDAGSAMHVPDGWSWEEAAAFPEVYLTVFLNLYMIGEVKEGTRVLVHGGGSGIGTASIALCRAGGAPIAVTAGSDEKCRRCEELGADLAINYRTESFVERVRAWSQGRGVDVILDSIGGSYLEPNVKALAMDGRLVIIGGMEGRSGELDLDRLLAKRLRIIGSTMRARPATQKAEIVRGLLARFGDRLVDLRPIVHRAFPLAEAGEAHRLMQSSGHFGKIVLRTED